MTRFPFGFLPLAAGLLAVFACGNLATAQKQPGLPLAPPPKLVADDDGKAKKAPPRVLTSESLAEMLESMGYDFRTETLPSGYVLYTVTIPSDSWKFVIEVSVPANGSLVWLVAPLAPLPAAGAVPSEPLVRLLQENWGVYPHAFAVPKNARHLYLQRAVENQNVTPAKFRAAIDAMTGTIRSTAPLWNVSNWGTTTTDTTSTTGGTAAYPDTPEGLTKLCKDVLALAMAGKRNEVAAKVKGMIVPSHEAWFRNVFGPELGESLADEYGTGLTQNEAGLTRSFMTAVEEGQTDVKVFKFTRPDPDNATNSQNKALQGMVVKTPLYSVYLCQPGEDSGMHLYSFVYIDGAFRMAGKMKAAPVITTGFRAEPNPFKLLTPPNGTQPEVNPIASSFNTPPALRESPLGFNGVTPPGATNELNPHNFQHLTPLLAAGGLPTSLQALMQRKKSEPRDDEPSIVGTWKGELNLANTRWTVTTTFRGNGTYKSVMEWGSYVMADTGTYTYADGILKTEPEGGITGTFTITFVDEDTMKAKGGGLSITYKRQ